MYWAKTVAFMNRQWWGMKIVYWLVLGLAALITIGYFLFKGSKKSKKLAR